MKVFIAGMPRSGSMWTYNVSRALLTQAGKTVLPEKIPVSELALLLEATETTVPEGVAYCIKTHHPLKPDIPGARIICNYRDVRDSMISYMRFMHCGFERGWSACQEMMEVTDYYFNHHTRNILYLKYDHLLEDALTMVSQIDTFLGTNQPQEVQETINRQFSRKSVQKLLNSLDKVETSANGEPTHSPESYTKVANLDGSYRVFHRDTSFQTRHITGVTPQDWKKELTPEQQEVVVNGTYRWLIKYGFEP